MQIFYELKKNYNLSLSLGFFDGVHEGHKVVLKNAVNLARQNNLKSAVVTFLQHPLCYLQNRKPLYIISLEERLELIKQQGIDYVYLLDFDEKIADLLAYDYLKDILINYFSPKFITTGFNHYFGANKQGDSTFLRNYQQTFGYRYFEIPPITFNNTLISSSKIRQMIADGEMESLPNILGTYFSITGRVVTGDRIGRTLSYPTANLDYPEHLIKPSKGVYAALVEVDEKKYNAIANYGKRPTVKSLQKFSLEVHLLDFNENIYDRDIKVSFVKKIREEQKFSSLSDLKSQLVKDEQVARNYFSKV